MTIQFMSYPAVNSDSMDKTLYGDIITHCKDWRNFAEASSKYTTAHECTHGVNNDLRIGSGDWDRKNGFYVGKDRAVILDEPHFKKSQIIEFIPTELRSARYTLYVVGQTSWDDKPLYIYDEGVAYINGAWAAIELKEQDNYVEKIKDTYNLVRSKPGSEDHGGFHQPKGMSPPYADPDGECSHYISRPLYIADATGNTIVDGHVEFITYMTAVLMAAEKCSLPLDTRLIDFSRWLFRHACNAYFRLHKDGFTVFDVQENLWQTLKTGTIANTMRTFLASKVGFVFPDGEVPEEDDVNPPWFV